MTEKREWQPIETAPKDGSLIMIGGYGDAGWFWADAKWDGGWMMWHPDDEEYTSECFLASHWKPLPEPPEQP